MKLDPEKLKHVSKGFCERAARSATLHADSYRDPEFLAAEQKHIFRNSWQFLCHEEKLIEPGSYFTAGIGGHSIVACRDEEEQLRAFYNVCKHRGHELLSGAGKTRSITCPYHAWNYNLDGTLNRARRSELIENFSVDSIALTQVQVEIFCHLVFVNLNTEAPSLVEQSGNLQSDILQYAPDLGQLTFAHRLEYRIQANWKAVIDNFLECYHCPVAHRDFVSLVEMDTYQVTTHGIYSSHMAKAGRGDNTAYGVESASVTDHAVWYLWPNTTLMRYPGKGNFMVWRFYPISTTETQEVFDFFLESANPSDEEIESIRYIDEVLQPEDIALVESVQRGMATPAFTQGRYLVDPEGSGMSEHAVHHFHQLIIDAYRGACDE